MRTYMIRHGKPSATWGDDDDDPGLDATGQAQAEAVAQLLIKLPEHVRPTAVVSSPLRRCRETAEPFARLLGVELVIDPRVGEIPTPRAVSRADRGAWLREAFAGAWSDIKGDLNYEDWRREVAEGLASHPGAAVFSHFVAINAAATLAGGGEQVVGLRPDHCSVQVFDVVDGRLVLVARGREASTQIL